MQDILRSIFSIAAIGIFAWFAMASFGSTNTSVQVEKCRPKPPFTGNLTIDVLLRHLDGTAIPNAPGTMFLVHQTIQDTTTCSFTVLSQQQIPFTTNGLGLFNYTTPEFTHSNEGDLWRVEILIPKVAGSYEGGRRIQAAKYNVSNLDFPIYEIPKL